jgi:C4-dicarboxylate-specific signal transduction histidine kinase
VTRAQSPSELDRWRSAAMGLQPLSALGQLTQMVAHDLNNYFQSIVLHLELLKPLGERDDKVRKHIARIAEAVEKAEAFIVYLRDVRSKSEKGADANVNDVIRGVVMLLAGTFRRANVTCEISTDKKMAPVGVPMLLVHEVLINVILNAVEACERGGIVTINSMQQEGSVIVEVHDSGEGMTEEAFERAVQPFFTTKGAEHQGLGLTVTLAVLDEHGGSLAFTRPEGGGTAVRVALPRAPHP